MHSWKFLDLDKKFNFFITLLINLNNKRAELPNKIIIS